MTAVPPSTAPAVPAVCFLYVLAMATGAAIAGRELRQLLRRRRA